MSSARRATEASEERIKQRIEQLPAKPGVYFLKGGRGRILYIGKAQNLKSRVRSYFRAGGDGRLRAALLSQQVREIDVVVTPNVKDALLLENELIKQHRPRFNVKLRDDKQYLGLRLDPRERWPRLMAVRHFRQDGAHYFGPYTSSASLRRAVSDLRRSFPLRSCSDGMFRDCARRGRPCIEYEMKRCAGPCCALVDPESYAELVQGTELFLRGRSGNLVRELTARMQAAAAEQRFEAAAHLRDRIGAVERTLERQQIVSDRPVDRDVFACARRGGEVEFQVLSVREGRVVGTADYAFSGVELDDAALFESFLAQYYAGSETREVPHEVLTPQPVDAEGALRALLRERAGFSVYFKVPQKGASAELLALARSNAELRLEQRLAQAASSERVLEELRERLDLSRLPLRIECYDVSAGGGVLAVASRVVFERGQPDKASYRRYRIRGAPAGDDYACLREVFARRLRAVEREPLPDLIVVDGGKGQLGVVLAALRDAGLELSAVALAKERAADGARARVRRDRGLKAERIFLPRSKDPLALPANSEALLLLQRIRDESHRFAIAFQRALRRKAHLASVLEELPGIGPAKRRALLRHLGSLRAVQAASIAELAAVPGIRLEEAQRIQRFFAQLLRAR